MKLLYMMIVMLVSCNVVASMSKQDKKSAALVKAQKEKEEIAAVVKIQIDSCLANAVAHIGQSVALCNIKKHVDDLTFPAHQIKRAASIEYLKQDIVQNQKYMQESLIKMKKNVLIAKPFLLYKDHSGAIIDNVASRLESAITTNSNDDVQTITQEFLHLLHHDGRELEIRAYNKKLKEDEQKALERKKDDLVKSTYQQAIGEAAAKAQLKIQFAQTQRQEEKRIQELRKKEEKKEQEAKNKKEQIALQQAADAQAFATQQQQKKEAKLQREKAIEFIDPEQELDAIIDRVKKIVDSEPNYNVLIDGLSYVERTLKSPLFKKAQLRDINAGISDVNILDKKLKKIQAKGGKNCMPKSEQLIGEIVKGISKVIVQFGNMAIHQVELLPDKEGAPSVAAAWAPAPIKSTDYQELHVIQQKITVFKNLKMDMSGINDMRVFVRYTLTTSPHFQGDGQIEGVEGLIETAELLYKSVCKTVRDGESTAENRIKVDTLLSIIAANYSRVLSMMERSIHNRQGVYSCIQAVQNSGLFVQSSSQMTKSSYK